MPVDAVSSLHAKCYLGGAGIFHQDQITDCASDSLRFLSVPAIPSAQNNGEFGRGERIRWASESQDRARNGM